jgi:hypothetical protein
MFIFVPAASFSASSSASVTMAALSRGVAARSLYSLHNANPKPLQNPHPPQHFPHVLHDACARANFRRRPNAKCPSRCSFGAASLRRNPAFVQQQQQPQQQQQQQQQQPQQQQPSSPPRDFRDWLPLADIIPRMPRGPGFRVPDLRFPDWRFHRGGDMRIASGGGGGDGGGGSTYTDVEERPPGPFPLIIRLKSVPPPSPPASAAVAAPPP